MNAVFCSLGSYEYESGRALSSVAFLCVGMKKPRHTGEAVELLAGFEPATY